MTEIPEMVERVAQAMFEADPEPFADEGAARFYARVAIKAMREPTAEMLDGATGSTDTWWLEGWFKNVAWPRAIAAALGEK
jgi:hypothetical protein